MIFHELFKKKSELVAIFDVGSASIGGMIIKYSKDEKPEIVSMSRVPINFLLDLSFEAFWRCSQDSFKKIADGMLKDVPCGPDRVFCFFSSPWFISQRRIAKIKREKPFEITSELLKDIVNQEVEVFKSGWKSKLPHWQGKPEFVEKSIMKTDLNGYAIKNPTGKMAKVLSADIYISLGTKEVKEGFRKIVLDKFGDVPLKFHTFPFVALNVLRKIVDTKNGFVFVDIGGEVSDVSLVRNDVIEETISFPEGGSVLVRKISVEFKTFLKDAIALLDRFKRGHTSSDETKKVQLIIEDVKNNWCDTLKTSLIEISQKAPLPQKICILGNKYISEASVECVSGRPFSSFTILGKPFEVVQISSKSVAHYFKVNKNLKKSNDVFMMLESLFLMDYLK